MYRATTHAIEVHVQPSYLARRSEPANGRYLWAYAVEIANHGAVSVQLLTRHWIITDETGHREEVRGPGVIGEQPILGPGESFRYVSSCPLTTPSGIMAGTYQMIDENGHRFDVTIPTFSLDSPQSLGVPN
jgi:ApaG protein